jgi:hypothetical protein
MAHPAVTKINSQKCQGPLSQIEAVIGLYSEQRACTAMECQTHLVQRLEAVYTLKTLAEALMQMPEDDRV